MRLMESSLSSAMVDPEIERSIKKRFPLEDYEVTTTTDSFLIAASAEYLRKWCNDKEVGRWLR